MSPRSKREYIEAVHLRYKHASRGDRTLILNELCATCGYNRKDAIRARPNDHQARNPPQKPDPHTNQPVGRIPPGFIEADTVAHCGNSLSGSEFLNYHLLRHFTRRKQPALFTRSRAYHKDDNAHIEQKNWTHVRQWLGYQRLDNPAVVPLLNNLYRREWRTFHNFFCPSVKLINKVRIGSKTIKQYDSPKTPYQRVIESPHVSQKVKNGMTKYLEKQNPFLLRKAVEEKIKKIFASITRVT